MMVPSNARRWMVCGGSVALSQPFLAGKPPTDAALEGTAAHWVAEEMFQGAVVEVGQLAPNGVMVDSEMIECAREYLSLLPKEGGGLEYHVHLDSIAPGMKGRIDATFQEGSTLHLWDYKYGHGYVEEFENWQLLVSAAGVDIEWCGIEQIEFHIFQPRCYQAEKHRMWSIETAEYEEHYLPKIKAQAQSILAGRASCVTNDSCKRCAASHACETLAKVGYETVDMAGRPHATELDAPTLARELKALTKAKKRLEARLVGLEEQGTAILKKGGRLPGFTMHAFAGDLKWSVPAETAIRMAQMSGKNIQKPPEAITPTQAIKAGLSEAVVSSLATRTPGTPKLKEVDVNKARKVFSR